MIPATSEYFVVDTGYTIRIIDDNEVLNRLTTGCRRMGLRPLYVSDSPYECLFNEVKGQYIPVPVSSDNPIPSKIKSILTGLGKKYIRGLIIFHRIVDLYNISDLFHLMSDLNYCNLGCIRELKLFKQSEISDIDTIYIEYDSESG